VAFRFFTPARRFSRRPPTGRWTRINQQFLSLGLQLKSQAVWQRAEEKNAESTMATKHVASKTTRRGQVTRAIRPMNRLLFVFCRLASVLYLALLAGQSVHAAVILFNSERTFARAPKEGLTSFEALVIAITVPFVFVLASYINLGRPRYRPVLGAAIVVTTFSTVLLVIQYVHQTLLGTYFDVEFVTSSIICILFQISVLLGVLLRSRRSKIG